MDFDSLYHANFKLLDDTVEDWGLLVGNLEKLETQAEDGLHKAANKANWAGINARVTKEFIGKTAGEFADAHTQAKTIHSILADTVGELKGYQEDLKNAIGRGQKKHLTVTSTGDGGFTVRAAKGHTPPEPDQSEVTALRDEVQKILDKATESDSSASKVLKAIADQSELGFSDAKYKNRDEAAAAIKAAEELAKIARKNPEDLTVKDFDRINAGLKKYKNDELFSEWFATVLGPQKTMEFWAGINDPGVNWEIGRDRLNQFDDLQRNLGMTLAHASQSDSNAMDNWRRSVIDLGDKPIHGDRGGPMGFQVMSNLMRTGDYDDQFMKEYGTKLMAAERKLTGNGEHDNTAWQHTAATQTLNRIGDDSGSDPLTGYLKGLSNSPHAATDFFSEEYVSKEDSPFERDTDGNGYKGKVPLSNFQYLFEEREWPQETGSDGDSLNTGKNNLALALEAATTGHPAGEFPTKDTPVHSAGQAKLVESIFASVSENPERLSKNGYMSDSMGQISAEFMPDIHRGLHAGDVGERQLFPNAGSTAELKEKDITRFLYTVGRNPEGYAAVNLGQASYTTQLMQHHFQNPDLYAADSHFDQDQRLQKGISGIARTAGTIEGLIGGGRAFEGELEGGAKDKEYNAAIESAGTWGGSIVGVGIGIGTAPMLGPGGIATAGLAGTAASEIISSITDGSMQDSSGEVIYRNGTHVEDTKHSTYAMVEEAARKAGENSGHRYPLIEASVGTDSQSGFSDAGRNVDDYIDGEGKAKELEEED
ncbi:MULTISPECIES: hypothetical protein [unclassified Streptomyces]|uniref:hypothetical protein n=1 Tax=unclassified Streptomyces TaxID=2593676 RepID=UPI002E37A26E|nr:hypothetical protein [Streptomyces sp. NBC_01280]WSE15326.1 hypothetical protein OG518_19380 [Streptomyces sp. NBC_01397]